MADKPGITSLFRRSEIEKTTDECSVCQEEVNFFGMFHHMRVQHPEEFPAWLLWAAAVIVALVLPVVLLVVWMMLYDTSDAVPVIVLTIALMVIAQAVIDRIGKDWEKKVNKEWKAAHPVRSKTKSRRGRSG